MIKKIALCGLFTSFAIVISSLERLIPLQAIIPLPGIKLGLSNCIILYVMCSLDIKYSFGVMMCKCTLVSFLFTGFTSLVYSLTGGVISVLGMGLLLKFPKAFSIYGVSVFGAVLHSIGQIFAASVMLNSVHVFSYLPVLLITSVITGLIIGIITEIINNRIRVTL